jgi:hypothetical protein
MVDTESAACTTAHESEHTFGRRLRAEDVSFEDRRDLLGDKSGRITTHYAAAELRNLVTAANKVCKNDARKTPAQHEVRDERALYARKDVSNEWDNGGYGWT